MKLNRTPVIVIGALAIAAIAGVTYGLVQQPAAQSPTPDPTSIAQSSPTANPSATAPVMPPIRSAPANAPAAPPETGTATDPAPSQPKPDTAATEPSRQIESCKVSMAQVDDPAPPLNVRSSPSSSASVVGQLKNGAWVTVKSEQNGWFAITEPLGWIAKQRTRSGCNQKVERVSFGKGSTSATVSDRFIGTGSHRYVLNAGKGQTMTIVHGDGPLPTLTAPDGKTLLTGQDDSLPQWTGTLPQTGDYTLLLDSNFKGYPYSFRVEVK